jgi:hypothetical protein
VFSSDHGTKGDVLPNLDVIAAGRWSSWTHRTRSIRSRSSATPWPGPRTWRLEPLGIEVRPPRFEDPHLMAVTAALEAANDEVGVEAAPAGTAEHELAHGHPVSTIDVPSAAAGSDDESRNSS